VSLPNYGGAENAERKKACVSVVKNDLGYLTAEALRTQRRKFSIKKYSELCVSVVKTSGIFTAEARRTLRWESIKKPLRTLCFCGAKNPEYSPPRPVCYQVASG